MAQKIESGLQMISRVTRRPDLEGLHATIFPSGPYPSQIVEITGEEGAGKTLLITDLLARCVLPKSFGDAQLPGRNCGALIINSSHHFDLFKMAEILQYYIKENCRTLNSSSSQDIIKKSLKNLTVINCYTNEQLQASLLNLESLILQEANISLLILDSISAFYWMERIHSNLSYNAYYTSIINTLKNLTSKFGITVFYTKPDTVRDSTKKFADTKIHLKKVDGKIFKMEITNYSEEYSTSIEYTIEKTFNLISAK